MKFKAKFTLLLILIVPALLWAQVDINPAFNSCLADQLHTQLLNEYPKYAARHQLLEEQIYRANKSSDFSNQKNTAQTIPVVVHIMHDYGPENISDQQILDAIHYLNEGFANQGYFDPTTGVDVEIDFCLAMRDPQNNLSTGINRVASELTNLTVETQDLELKSGQWNPLDYLNIWVVNEITSLLVGPGVGAYAYFPAAHGLAQDGIVIEANFFGSTADSSKVLIHEAGHYLGLYHTFRDACTNNDCLLDGDRICDTPPDQSTLRVECDETLNSCNSDEDDTSINNPFRAIALGGLGDQNDMFINYMDYSYLPCYSAFTAGQKVRMKNALSTVRKSLLNSFGCQAPCPFSAFAASFSSSPTSPVLAGEEVTFANSSAPANYYEWRVDDQIFSNEFNSKYTFEQDGFFKVKLLIRDTINFCTSTHEQIIEVLCDGAASFSVDTTDIIIAGETILNFTNTSTPHDSYEWYLDGNLYSTTTDLSITFPAPGYYTIYLVGVNSNCSNYSAPINIDVGACSAEEYNLENHWYFVKDAALDFNSGEAVPISGNNMDTYEGSACISDDNGDLLFYTDGFNIFDATNTVMPNGSGLLSSMSTRDAALIVPCPYHPHQYYVFACDGNITSIGGDSQYGITYSIVDMTLNGGLGDVTEVKNYYLCPANNQTMNAAYHADGEKAWLVIRANPKVLNTYLIDSTGISDPIPFTDVNDVDDTTLGIGIFFNSGKKMIFTRFNYDTGYQNLVIFDFDNVNGILSNAIEFRPSENEDFTTNEFALSPDDRKLYTIMRVGPRNEGIVSLYQFYLPLAIGQQVASSRTRIQNMSQFNKLLLGPNGKIYVSNNNEKYMGVINHPNENGMDCNYVFNGVNISPSTNMIGLPKFIKGKGFDLGVKEPEVDLGPDRNICPGTTIVLNEGGDENYNFLWQDGSTDPIFTAWLPGTYSVTVTNECGPATDEINIEFAEDLLDLGEDIVSSLSSVTLDAGEEWDYYLWQDSSTNSKLAVTESGEYWVYARTEEGCYQSDTINVFIDLPTNLFKPTLIIYPNPSNGLFLLEEKNADVINDIKLTIYDPLGRKVYEEAALLKGKMEIDLREYASGFYFLHWSTLRESGVFKLIIASQ